MYLTFTRTVRPTAQPYRSTACTVRYELTHSTDADLQFNLRYGPVFL